MGDLTSGAETREALRRTAEKFLGGWSLSLDDLADFAPKVDEGECLVLCSTIPEGLANELSDIDLIYVGGNELKGKVRLRLDRDHDLDVSHTASNREVNVARLPIALMKDLSRTLSASIGVVENGRLAPDAVLEHDAQRLIFAHRLRNAVPLKGEAAYAEWRERLHLDKVHLHFCWFNVHHYLNRREDVAGEIEAGHIESALWAAKTIMAPRLAAALLAAIEVTNPARKWHLRLLRRHQQQIGPEIVDGLIDFIMGGAASDGDRLLETIWEVCEPALQRVYELQGQVHRAAYRFSRLVRYDPPHKSSQPADLAMAAQP